MGLRLYRRLKIAPGLSLNLSGSGISASFGPRGAKLTVGPRGVFGSVGLPGTGISYRQKLNASEARTPTRRLYPPSLDPANLAPEALELMQAVVDGKDGVTKTLNTSEEVLSYWDKVKCLPGAHMIHPETGRKMNDAQIRAFARKVDRDAAVKKLSEEIAAEEARLAGAVRCWHPLPDIPPWESYVQEYENLLNAPFPEPAPAEPAAPDEGQAWAALLESERDKISLPRWLRGICSPWVGKRAEAEAKGLWPEYRASLQAEYERQTAEYESARRSHAERADVWREKCGREAAEQYALMSGESRETLLSGACEAIQELSLPFKADAQVMLEDDVSLMLDIDLPEIEDVVPHTVREVSATGAMKSSRRTGDDLNEPYAELVLGHCLNLAAKLFIELPRLQTMELAAYTRRGGEDDYVLDAKIGRDAMTAISQEKPANLQELLASFGKANALFELDGDSRFKAIEPPAWKNGGGRQSLR